MPLATSAIASSSRTRRGRRAYGDRHAGAQGHRHLDEKDIERIHLLIEDGGASTVSGFVRHAVAITLDDTADWGAILAEALDQTGGPLTDDERAWADEVLNSTVAR